jgi:hypothetical protein
MAALVWLLSAALAAPPAAARKHPKHGPPAARAEDDARLKGDAPAFARAALTFTSPEDLSEIDPDDEVQVELKISGYALGALHPGGPLPHAHLIVDNEPAFEIDDARATFAVHGLGRGPHVLRAVLCRPGHEVVKAPRAFAIARFWVGPKLEGKAGQAAEFVAWPDIRKPLVTYVLPVGEPSPHVTIERDDADAPDDPPAAKHAPHERPMLDFYLSNVKLGRRGDKVRLVLDKRELPLVTEWKPQHLRHARPGPHKLTIDLLNRKGLKVKNAFNRTDRSFTASN